MQIYRLSILKFSCRFKKPICNIAKRHIVKLNGLQENHNNVDWNALKEDILNKGGDMKSSNSDAVFFQQLINMIRLDSAMSFESFLKPSYKELSVTTISSILYLYFILGKENKLTKEHKDFILHTYKYLYAKNKNFDCIIFYETLLRALCSVGEWRYALKVLENIRDDVPTHSAYSTIIGTQFKCNEKAEAMKLIQKASNRGRFLQHNAYYEWIEYIHRVYKNRKCIENYLQGIGSYISKNNAFITKETMEKLKDSYIGIGWSANFTKVSRESGYCGSCKQNLRLLKLTKEEFQLLQDNIRQYLTMGSDIFSKSLPTELNAFREQIENSAPYDIVIDALNVSRPSCDTTASAMFLKYVTEHFVNSNKKVMLVGRKHMLTWPREQMDYILNSTNYFFADNMSPDDPYLIAAAILSGPNTDILSNDLLRDHRINFRDAQLKRLFQIWRWQHQWMMFGRGSTMPRIKSPLAFSPCAQKVNGFWHFWYIIDERSNTTSDGVPDFRNWICLKPPTKR